MNFATVTKTSFCVTISGREAQRKEEKEGKKELNWKVLVMVSIVQI